MRIIFSRKGFDSSYGKAASPILPDGTLLSIPIPELDTGLRYADLRAPNGSSYLEVMQQLSIDGYNDKNEAHLDPDIRRDVLTRHEDWKPVFGQCSAAQTILANNGVREGDLFLFYGNFRRTKLFHGRLTFDGPWLHILFAYLWVGKIVRVNSSTDLPWCKAHPHLVIRKRPNNTLYISADHPSGAASERGSGIFSFDEDLVLTKPGANVSKWRIPRFFHPEVGKAVLSHHRSEAWTMDDTYAYLQTKSPGQEYVMEADAVLRDWATNLIAKHAVEQ
jgi:hypothetical protein